MNDVKLNVISLGGSSNTTAAGATSSAPQPRESRPSDSEKQPSKVQEFIRNQEISKSSATEETKQRQDQQKEQVQQAVSKLNDYIQSVQRDLQFSLDDASGKVIVKVVDRNTNEVVRQIPDEVALDLARKLQKDEPISLLSTKA